MAGGERERRVGAAGGLRRARLSRPRASPHPRADSALTSISRVYMSPMVGIYVSGNSPDVHRKTIAVLPTPP